MRTKDFLALKKCDRNFRFNRLIECENKRPLLLAKAVSDMADSLKKGRDVNSIIEMLRQVLSYKEEWFETAGLKELYENDDLISFSRFLLWWNAQNYTIVDTNVQCVSATNKPFCGKETMLTMNVPIVAKKEGRYIAFLISPKKADHSPQGRSISTNTSTQLDVMVAKEYLEQKYPGISIYCVHLRSELDEDGNMWPEFSLGNTKKSNLLIADFSEFTEGDGAFEADLFHNKLLEVVYLPLEKPCFDCKNSLICKAKPIDAGILGNEESARGYVIPSYTEEQQAVIDTVNGPVVVCAGPGSGKTATLVGRVKHMIDLGIKPENILIVTYTRKAAGELIDRIGSFCEGSDIPYIATINKLGNEILLHNKKLLNRSFSLLSSADKAALIDRLSAALPHLEGIKYGKKYGRTGYLRTIERKLDTFFELGDYEAFHKKEPKLGNDFPLFAEMYAEAVKAGGYITYDEQVSLCIKLFREHPDILTQYHSLYRYIMVDEFQDVNSDNAELIYLLSGKDKNLCVVGDDDQNIYGFRGGDVRFMLGFPERFEGAKKFVLGKNFRSSENIISFSKEIVSTNERIKKDITAVRGAGQEPLKVPNNSPSAIDSLIRDIVKGGKYRYGDIAVLSTKNAPLSMLHETLEAPTILAKQPLIKEPLFLVISSILTMYYKGIDDKSVAILLYTLFNEQAAEVNRASSLTLYDTLRGAMPDITDYTYYKGKGDGFNFKVLSLFSRLINVVETAFSVDDAIEKMTDMVGATDSAALSSLKELIEERGIATIQELHTHMEYMLLMEDDEKVDIGSNDAVLLITSHESKGKEFPVVILQDGDSYSDDEEKRRLLYVASTRAKDLLFICYDSKKGMPLGGTLNERRNVV